MSRRGLPYNQTPDLGPTRAPYAVAIPKSRSSHLSEKLDLGEDLIARVIAFGDQMGSTSINDTIKTLVKMGLSSSPETAALGHARQRAIHDIRKRVFGELAQFFEQQSDLYKMITESFSSVDAPPNPIQNDQP